LITLDGLQNKAKEIDASNKTPFNPDALWKLQMEKGFPYNVAILSEHTLDLSIHFVKGQGAVLCDKMYFDQGDPEASCEECLKPGYMGEGINYPILVKCMVGYCFDLKDKKDKNKKGEEFTHHPLKIIEVQAGGRKLPNWEKLDEAAREDYLVFNPNAKYLSIWKLKRKEDKGMVVPDVLDPRELEKLPYATTVEQSMLDDWKAKTKGEVWGCILQSYGNLKREEFPSEIVFPEAYTSTEAEEPAAEAPAPAKRGKSKEVELD
jgi:hypothetical protein